MRRLRQAAAARQRFCFVIGAYKAGDDAACEENGDEDDFLAFGCMGIPPNGVGENIAYDFDTQPFRLLAKARSHLPFQGRY